MVLIKKQD